jgi:hypothetical protein
MECTADDTVPPAKELRAIFENDQPKTLENKRYLPSEYRVHDSISREDLPKFHKGAFLKSHAGQIYAPSRIQFRLTLSCEDEDLTTDQEETHLPIAVVAECEISILLELSVTFGRSCMAVSM